MTETSTSTTCVEIRHMREVPLREDDADDAIPVFRGPFTDHAGHPAQHPPIWR